MKTKQLFIIITLAVLFAGCATTPPHELVNARLAYQRASEGQAARLAPAELHKAQEALNRAEQSFQKDPDSTVTKDLSYVAQRKSELARVAGILAADTSRKDSAEATFQREQTEIVKQGKQDLRDANLRTIDAQAEIDKQAALREAKAKSDAEFQRQQALTAQKTRQDLSDAQRRTDIAQNELALQQAATANKAKQDLIDSEKRTADLRAELDRLAVVKEEERGLVVSLSGGVLFRSAESSLLPSAQVKLDSVTKALLSVSERNIIVEGHTDSRGSESYNQDLSQRRADAVREYIVKRGYPADRIQSHGMGKGSPIANNASPEGRANNRRVEIVIERQMQTSNR
jgi:outer membrane protein OmpA-like peptidoglycan-associated protein